MALSLLKNLAISFIGALMLLASISISFASSWQNQNSIVISTGSVSGLYYPAGGVICKVINSYYADSTSDSSKSTKCLLETTGGSIYNLSAIRNGEVEIGIAQNDWQYYSYNGLSIFKDFGPDKDLRALFSLHIETLAILAKSTSGIKSLDDIKGKRVNLGSDGSALRLLSDHLLKIKNLSKSDLSLAKEIKPSEQINEFCNNNLDIIGLIHGNPSYLVEDMIKRCDAVLIPLSKEEIDSILKELPFYTISVIPAKTYSNQKSDIMTIGVRSTVFTHASFDNEMAYNVTKLIFENINELKQSHPIFLGIKKEDMARSSVIPLHDGSKRYFQEQGLVTDIVQ